MVSEAVRTNGMYFGAIYYHGKTTVTTGRMFQILYFSSSRGFAQSGPKALRAVMNTVGGGGGGGGTSLGYAERHTCGTNPDLWI